MAWAQRLKRVFKIDIETCRHCGGAVKVIACIEDPVVIKQILEHLERRIEQPVAMTPTARAPPRNTAPGRAGRGFRPAASAFVLLIRRLVNLVAIGNKLSKAVMGVSGEISVSAIESDPIACSIS